MFSTTTAGALVASIGSVSTPVFDSIYPYLIVAAGIPLAFYIGKKLISLIPKGK